MNKRSFTLMEVIITILIASILAYIAVAPLKMLIGRVVLQEAVVGMNKIRVAERIFRARHGNYTTDGWWQPQNPLGIDWDDLDGQYFLHDSYLLPLLDWSGQPLIIRATTTISGSSFVRDVLFGTGVELFMTENGSVFSNDPDRTGYPLPPW